MGEQQQSTQRRFFASDNASPVHPRVLEAIVRANHGHAVAYGDDSWTREGEEAIRRLFGTETETFFVYNGTGANVLAVAGTVPSYGAVVCTEMAHLNEDEAGAPEKFAGCKLLPADRPDGKLRPEDVRRLGAPGRIPHQSVPFLVSVTQATEIGTVYTPGELREICDAAHGLGLLVHLDGARIANAAVAVSGVLDELGDGADLEAPPVARVRDRVLQALREMIVDAGVDIVSFGGTKNGLMFGEALVFLGPRARERSAAMPSLRKQGMQLNSKMRFTAAQFVPYLDEDLWIANALQANTMARRLSRRLRERGVTLAAGTQANGVFPVLPMEAVPQLQERWPFYIWNESEGVCRLMCSFDTQPEEVDAFAEAAGAVIS